MHVHSIPIVCLRSTSGSNGPPKPDFQAGPSTPSDKPQMDTSGLERTEACYVSTALISGLSHSLPSPPLRTFPYCNCLRTPAENWGTVHRRALSQIKTVTY